MKRYCATTISLMFLSNLCCVNSFADTHRIAKRIEVYVISQSFWDVMPGDTLSGIAQQLLPNNPVKRKQLERDILSLNANAFVQNNPDRLKANVRLWFANTLPAVENTNNRENYHVKSFSWGQVYRAKR